MNRHAVAEDTDDVQDLMAEEDIAVVAAAEPDYLFAFEMDNNYWQ